MSRESRQNTCRVIISFRSTDTNILYNIILNTGSSHSATYILEVKYYMVFHRPILNLNIGNKGGNETTLGQIDIFQ